jgi:hypothetical protein
VRAVTRVHDRRIECGVDAEVDSGRRPAAPADQRAVAPGLGIHRANLHEQQRDPSIHEIVPVADSDGRLLDAADCNHVISHSLRSAVREGGAAARGEADTVLGNPKTRLAAEVQRVIEAFPPLTLEQRARLTRILISDGVAFQHGAA